MGTIIKPLVWATRLSQVWSLLGVNIYAMAKPCFFYCHRCVWGARHWRLGPLNVRSKWLKSWTLEAKPILLVTVIAEWAHILLFYFFPRASERRVLLIVGVCYIHLQTSSHLHIFTSSHLHIFSPSHLHIFTYFHLFISTSYHLHIFTPSHLHILSSSYLHIFSSSHLLIFTSSHFTSSLSCPLALLPSFSLALLPSCPLAFLPSCSLGLLLSCPLVLFSLLPFYFSLKARGSANEAPQNATFSHETRFDRQKLW